MDDEDEQQSNEAKRIEMAALRDAHETVKAVGLAIRGAASGVPRSAEEAKLLAEAADTYVNALDTLLLWHWDDEQRGVWREGDEKESA